MLTDKVSADDLLGTHDVYLSHLMRPALQGKMHDREDDFLSEREAEEAANEDQDNEGDGHEGPPLPPRPADHPEAEKHQHWSQEIQQHQRQGNQSQSQNTQQQHQDSPTTNRPRDTSQPSHPSEPSGSTSKLSTTPPSSSKKRKSHGTLGWSVGYFQKTGLVEALGGDEGKAKEIEEEVWKEAESKLREDKDDVVPEEDPDPEPTRPERQFGLDSQSSSQSQDASSQSQEASGITQGQKDQERSDKAKASSGNNDTSEVEQLKQEDLAERTNTIIAESPPSKEYPSGILRVWIESIDGLEVEDVRGNGEDVGKGVEVEGGGMDDEGEGEGGQVKPSGYCDIIVNCERWYKTRVKVRSGNPYVGLSSSSWCERVTDEYLVQQYNAGTERFIRDWESTIVLIAVKDFRLNESHPLLGTVHLPLTSIFAPSEDKTGCSHISQSFPLIGGIGFGKINLKVTFRSLKLHLPRELRGWDVGTVRVEGDVEAVSSDGVGMVGEELRACKLIVRSVWGRGKMRAVAPETGHAGGTMKWRGKRREKKVRDGEVQRHEEQREDGEGTRKAAEEESVIELPIQRRYTECVVFEWKRHERGLSRGISKLGREVVDGYAVLWLTDLLDSPPPAPLPADSDSPSRYSHSGTFEYNPDLHTVKLQVYTGTAEQRNRAMFNHTVENIGEPMKGVIVSVRVQFVKGMTIEAHGRTLARKDKSVRTVIEAMGCVEATEGGLDLDSWSDSDSSDPDSDDDDDDDDDQEDWDDDKKKGGKKSHAQDKNKMSSNPFRQLYGEFKGYNERKDQLHRKHRGVMQFKPARQADAAAKGVKNKALGVKDKVLEKVGQGEKAGGGDDAARMVGGGQAMERESGQ